MKQVYTIKELSKRWGMAYQTIFQLIKRGEIKAFKIGDSWRVKREEVERIESGIE